MPFHATNIDAHSGYRGHYHHSQGFNSIYFDGHAKLVPFGRKWSTLPAMGWPPEQAPQ